MNDPSVAWMKRRGIQEACAGNPGLHPGYAKGLSPSKTNVTDCWKQWR